MAAKIGPLQALAVFRPLSFSPEPFSQSQAEGLSLASMTADGDAILSTKAASVHSVIHTLAVHHAASRLIAGFLDADINLNRASLSKGQREWHSLSFH